MDGGLRVGDKVKYVRGSVAWCNDAWIGRTGEILSLEGIYPEVRWDDTGSLSNAYQHNLERVDAAPRTEVVAGVKVGDAVIDEAGFAGKVIHIHEGLAWVSWADAWDDVVSVDGLKPIDKGEGIKSY